MTSVRIVEEVPGVPTEEQYFVTVDWDVKPAPEWLPGFEKYKHPHFADSASARKFCDERGWTVTKLEPFEP